MVRVHGIYNFKKIEKEMEIENSLVKTKWRKIHFERLNAMAIEGSLPVKIR